jgi:cystathionine beta-lyase
MQYDFDQALDRIGTDSTKWGMYPKDVIPLWVADMDFRSAEPIIQALQRRVDQGIFGYGRASEALKLALQERLRGFYQWHISPEQILFLPGIVAGLNVAIQAFVGPGEEVLIQPPVYFHFFRDPVHHGRSVSDPPLVRKGNTYEIDFDRFERGISDRTRIFILCNPHNPVGRVFTAAELERIAEICLRHRLIIISDEIHCDLLYADIRHTPIATLSSEVAARTITLMAPSKTYNLAGLACGYAVIQNEALRRAWQKASFGIVPAVNVMGYVASHAALTNGQEWLDQVMAYLQANRDYLAAYVRENLPGMRMCAMEATYLAWLDCEEAALPENPAEFFLNKARVGLSAGLDFGKTGAGFVRLNFACPRVRLSDALGRMASALKNR